MNLLAVFIGGGLGSVCRYLLTIAYPLQPNSFPFATFFANLISCFVLGIAFYFFLNKAEVNEPFKLLLTVGFCGGFSTFSTFSLENLQLYENGNYQMLILNIVLSILLGVALCWLGVKTGKLAFGA